MRMLNAMHMIARSLPQAARREVRYRLSPSQFAPDDRTREQLRDMALQRAWRERMRLSPYVDRSSATPCERPQSPARRGQCGALAACRT
jgi:hypothetical protein